MTLYPTHVTIETTTVCNVIPPCVMCAKHTDARSGWLNNDASHFPKELLPKIAGVLGQARVLSLYGIGEPLTCPYVFDFKELAAPDCHLQFTTNGWLLNEANIDKILSTGIALMDVSLDATTQRTYDKIRHGDLAEVVQKVANLITERNRRGSQFPSVCLNMCLMRENIDDLPGLPKLAKGIGANHCYAFHMNQGMGWKTQWFSYEDQHCSADPDRHDLRVMQAFQQAVDLDMTFEIKGAVTFASKFDPPKFNILLPSPLKEVVPVRSSGMICPLPWSNVIIYRDGSVTNCCWQGQFMGNLHKNTFEEIWDGAMQTAVRDHIKVNGLHDACKGPLLCPVRGRV